MRRTIHPGSRGGFTLVELLVVVTIIAVLIALISSGVMAALARGSEVSARNEVTQLANGVQAFKGQFQVQYIPDKLVLPPGFDAATQQFLASAWPRLDQNMLRKTDTTPYPIPSRVNDPNMPGALKSVNVFSYWQVSGAEPTVLHGDQVLVWALGGWRDVNTNNVFGFSTDSTDPMKPYLLSPGKPASQRHGPYYDFTADRLKILALPKGQLEVSKPSLPKRSISFPSFIDYYGKAPYLYFSSGKAGNDYTNPIAAFQDDPNQPWIAVFAYQTAANKFANPSGFQIVSAGRDGLFGNGGLGWSGGGGQMSTGGKDDIGNFSATKLGD